jgi:hypothetical protein
MERILEEESVKSALSGTKNSEGIFHRCTLATRPDELISFWASLIAFLCLQMWAYAHRAFQSARKFYMPSEPMLVTTAF